MVGDDNYYNYAKLKPTNMLNFFKLCIIFKVFDEKKMYQTKRQTINKNIHLIQKLFNTFI